MDRNLTLNLVSPRTITSAADLVTFKHDATAAVLQFAAENPCDLEAFSRTLQDKYTEIASSLASGYHVESGLEMVSGCTGCFGTSASDHRVSDEENPESRPLRYAKPPTEEEAASDPLALMIAEEEAASGVDVNDLLEIVSKSPEKSSLADRVLQHAAGLADHELINILTRLADDRYTSREIRALKASLKILSADEPNPDDMESLNLDVADEEADEAAEAAPSSKIIAADIPEDIKSEIEKIIKETNSVLAGIDPESMDLMPLEFDVLISQISKREELEARRPDLSQPAEHKEDSSAAFSHWMAYVRELFAPALQAASPADLRRFFNNFKESMDFPGIVQAWYEQKGVDPYADTLAGITQFIAENAEYSGISADQVFAEIQRIAPSAVVPIHFDLFTRAIEKLRGLSASEPAAKEEARIAPEGEVPVLTSTPVLLPVTEPPAEWTDAQKEHYKFKVETPTGKVLGYYPDEASARLAHGNIQLK